MQPARSSGVGALRRSNVFSLSFFECNPCDTNPRARMRSLPSWAMETVLSLSVSRILNCDIHRCCQRFTPTKRQCRMDTFVLRQAEPFVEKEGSRKQTMVSAAIFVPCSCSTGGRHPELRGLSLMLQWDAVCDECTCGLWKYQLPNRGAETAGAIRCDWWYNGLRKMGRPGKVERVPRGNCGL
jgi:hypothetical protein